jgi:uncharacterized protein (TIGR03435 family)
MIPEYLSPLANHLWQSTMVVGVAALLVLALRKNSARVRYWLWFAAALKFVIPFSLLVSIGQQFEWRTPPIVTQRPLSTVAELSMPFDSAPAAAEATPIASSATSMNLLPGILVFIWVGGFAVSLGLWICSWRRIHGALQGASPMHVEFPVKDISVRVMSSPTLLEPAVFGILRPVLLLPDGLADRMTPQQFKAIMVHELCHVRRRDNLATAIYMAIEALFWFYPLLRWIGKRLLDERERACDEEVIRLGNEPGVYAEGILNVCKTCLESPLQCAAGVTGSDLKKRIRAILNGRVVDVNVTKKITLAVTGLCLLAMPLIVGVVSASQAQLPNDISGTWQGVLRAGARELRIVMKISRNSGGLKALQYSIDQGADNNPSSSVTVQDSNIKMSFPGNGGTYEGKLNAEANLITGTWSQGGPQLPLNLARATAETAWAIPEPAPLKRMPPDANPAFEVATIKLSRPDDQRPPMILTQPGRFMTTNKTVMDLITYSYSIYPGQIVNGPAWLDTKYEVTGQPPEGAGQPSERQWKIMLQKLLADRFKLSVHRDKKELPIYALTVAKNGPKLTPSTAGDLNNPQSLAMRARGRFTARNANMVDFAGELQSWLDRPVVDQTGISGRYDFALSWTPDEYQTARLSGFAPPLQLNGEVPDLFTAIQEQLGMKLDSTKGVTEVLVIDNIQRATEN